MILIQCTSVLIFVCIFFFLNFQYTKKENHFKLVIIYYSFCVLAVDAISNLAKRPYIRIKSEDRHAAYCFKPGTSLYTENTFTKHRRHYKMYYKAIIFLAQSEIFLGTLRY